MIYRSAMLPNTQRPVALTIAGSDSGGGAGVQADLKTFAALGVHGASAIAGLTAQNPRQVLALQPVSPKMLRQQIEAVFAELSPRAVKTGMLLSAQNVHAVAEFFKRSSALRKGRQPGGLRRRSSALSMNLGSEDGPLTPALSPKGEREKTSQKLHRVQGFNARILRGILKHHPPLIVDPVMVASSGTRLLDPDAIAVLARELLPLAALVTPNLSEAEILAERRISTAEDLRAAARLIYRRFGCAALVKGGHLPAGREALDIFFDGQTELLLTAPFIAGIRTHGTGCTYSAAIAAYLALGFNLQAAVKRAKPFVTRAIAGSYRIGRHSALNPRR